MELKRTNKCGKAILQNDDRDSIISELSQLCFDFLLVTWLLVDKMFPEQLSELRDTPAVGHDRVGEQQGVETNCSNFKLFLCISGSLNRHGGLTMGHLSRAISVPYSTATRIVDWMVDRGYAQRLPDSDDKRKVLVVLTDSGRKFSHDAKVMMFERSVESLKQLSEVRRKTLLINMKEVIDVWTSILEDSS